MPPEMRPDQTDIHCLPLTTLCSLSLSLSLPLFCPHCLHLSQALYKSKKRSIDGLSHARPNRDTVDWATPAPVKENYASATCNDVCEVTCIDLGGITHLTLLVCTTTSFVLFYALFIVSRIIMICHIHRQFRRKPALDKWC